MVFPQGKNVNESQCDLVPTELLMLYFFCYKLTFLTIETEEDAPVSSPVEFGQSTETGNTPTERRQPYANSSGK